MDDIFRMMPQAKKDSKMQKKESLFAVNEIAEMKNCSKCLLFEGRRKKDVYLWASVVAWGPSAKFEVENIHTMAELKMTGNCLAASRPLLSFSEEFTGDTHWSLIKELLTGIFGVPNHHPKSQPFFDHVFTFSIVDGKVQCSVTRCSAVLRGAVIVLRGSVIVLRGAVIVLRGAVQCYEVQ